MSNTTNRIIALILAIMLFSGFAPNTALANPSTNAFSENTSSQTLRATKSTKATTFPVHTIKKNVDDDSAFVMLFMGDGYTKAEQEKFLRHVKERTQTLLRLEPYRQYSNYINVYAMCVESNERGASITDVVTKDTYLGVGYQSNSRAAEIRAGDFQQRIYNLRDEVSTKVLTSSSKFVPKVSSVHIISHSTHYHGRAFINEGYSISSLNDGGITTGAMAVHEISHQVGHIGDEYASNTNYPNVDTAANGRTGLVKWHKMLGFGGVGITENSGASVVIPGRYCLMKHLGYAALGGICNLCEVCRLEVARHLLTANNLSKAIPMHIAYPEITKAYDPVTTQPYAMNLFRISDKFGSSNMRDCNDSEIEFRTVVQNVDKKKGRNIKLSLETFNADGSAKQSAEGAFVVSDYGNSEAYLGMNNRQSLQSLSVKMKCGADYDGTEKILGKVIDADTGEVLATDKNLWASNEQTALNIRYVDSDTRLGLKNVGGAAVYLGSGETYQVTHPSSVAGYQYVGNDSTNDRIVMNSAKTLTYYFAKAANTEPEPETETETEPEPDPEPESRPEPEPVPEPETDPDPGPQPAPGPGPTPRPAPGSKPIAVKPPTAKTGLVYNGRAQTGVNGATGYTLSGQTGTNAGSYRVTATLAKGYVWSDGSSGAKTIGWSIAKAKPSYTVPSNVSGVQGGRLSGVKLPDGWAWKTPNTTLSETGKQQYDAIYTPKDTRNYTTVAQKLTVNVTAKSTPAWPQSSLRSQLRRVAGNTRYDTMSGLVSTAFPETAGTVVVANGGNYPDALSASGLAGVLGAPIVLTDSGSLSAQAASQLKRLKPSRIVIAGGKAAVSSRVESQLHSYAKSVERQAGSTRYDTSYQLYARGGKSWSMTAIVATGANYADALSISSYAYAMKAPVFLCEPNVGLDAQQKSALAKNFTRVVVVGGENAVPSRFVKGLPGLTRLSGSTRYETSVSIAKWTQNNGLGMNGAVYATGENFADALAAGPLAGRSKAVMLLVANRDSATVSYSANHSGKVTKAYVAGGTNAVSTDTANTIADKLNMKRP